MALKEFTKEEKRKNAEQVATLRKELEEIIYEVFYDTDEEWLFNENAWKRLELELEALERNGEYEMLLNLCKAANEIGLWGRILIEETYKYALILHILSITTERPIVVDAGRITEMFSPVYLERNWEVKWDPERSGPGDGFISKN